MTYTKQVCEYCENHKGTVIDVSKVNDEEFAEIRFNSLLNILNRLEEEKIVTSVSKGVCFIGKLKSCNQPNVLKQHIGDGNGIVVDYMLHNSMDNSNYHSPISEIYTNDMSLVHKNIDNGEIDIEKFKSELDKLGVDVILSIIIILSVYYFI